MQISLDQLEKSLNRYNENVPETTETEEQLSETTKSIGNIFEEDVIEDHRDMVKRREMIKSTGHEPVDFAFERAIGKNDSVYSNFVDLIVDAKRKVGRIAIKKGNKNLGFATGFMVSDELMLTNWHVFRSKGEVNESTIQFHYELDNNGEPSDHISFNLAPDVFFYTFEELDFCLIAVQPEDISGQHKLSDIGFIFLDPETGKVGVEGVERLNLIHHPDGDYKQLSIRENLFKKKLRNTLWYESDTSQGSSGSPVFNDQWQVVALHHMGIAKKDSNGDYLDKNNEVIPIIEGKIDISKIHWIANEGIRISVIREHLLKEFPDSTQVKAVFNPFHQSFGESIEPASQNLPAQNYSNIAMKDAINISIPADLLKEQPNITVSISTNGAMVGNSVQLSQPQHLMLGSSGLAMETLKIERETDYSDCKGYRSDFLGNKFRVSIPKPLKSIRNHVARIVGSRAYILKYYKYSVIFNELKRMPLISAINVEGDPDLRQDNSKRKDVWIRDNRIDLDTQLDNKFYKKSGFDRGHMSRREDANWGDTPLNAKRNADMTCIHTNACPQVPELNRSSRKGLWGQLEKIILEKGAEEETGKTGKISVFSGPIFNDADPIFRGIKIPMAFYKVILWISDDGKLKATAFKLSQSKLVEEIDFEDIGVDQDIKFKEYQISLKDLQKETQIDFSDMVPFDTFKGRKREVAIENESQLMEMLKA
ncbi:MAG: DNA/RNA non-specific endonuclease [Bacteroidota bacterium]